MPSSAWAGSPAAYGRRAERLAAWWLWLHGFRVRRDVHVAGRQVDLVGRRGDLLVVCEVKATARASSTRWRGSARASGSGCARRPRCWPSAIPACAGCGWT